MRSTFFIFLFSVHKFMPFSLALLPLQGLGGEEIRSWWICSDIQVEM